MEFRTVEITAVDAKDLKSVNLVSKMDVYAVVSISGDPRTKRRTPVDKEGARNPSWRNLSLRFDVPASPAQHNHLTLDFVLRSERAFGDRDIGGVSVPLGEILENPGRDKDKAVLTYQVRTKSGKTHGTLCFSFKIGEKFSAPVAPSPVTAVPKGYGEPVMAYPPPPPPPPQSYPSQYPPPGYGYAQPSGYGYPQPPAYGYHGYAPPVQRPKKNNNKFGLGLGAGLLGGLLVGDMVSDMGDAGYGDGFGDGFDF